MTDEEKRRKDAERLRQWRAKRRAEYIASNGELKRGRPRVSEEIQKQKRAEREKRYQEKKRLEAPPKPQKPPQPQKDPKPKEQPVSTSVTPASINRFPCDSIVAAAVNQKHGITTVLAAAQADDHRKSVIIERIRTELGFYLFRVKCTNYVFCQTKSDALETARKEADGMKLKLYDSLTKEENEGGDSMLVADSVDLF